MTPTEVAERADAELLAELDGGVLTLTINRADSSNAIPYYVRDRLIETFQDAHTDLTVRCIVLTGAGERHFCTGSDLRIRPPAAAKPEGAPDMVVGSAVAMMRTGFQQLMERIQDCQKPVIVALNGTAAGGGAMLTLAADLVIASDTAQIVDVFGKPRPDPRRWLPLPAPPHRRDAQGEGDRVLRRRDHGAGRGRPRHREQGRARGDLRDRERDAWADRLAAKPTKVLGWAKKLLHDATENSRTATLEAEARFIELNLATEDGKERMAAMMEKRDPVWKGW